MRPLNFPIDLTAFREKIVRYRPQTIASTSKKAERAFYGRPTKAVALGDSPPQKTSDCLSAALAIRRGFK